MGLIPQWYLDGLDVEARAASWVRILEEGQSTVLMHFDERVLTGFASIGSSRDPDAAANWGEIGAFYYLRTYWGKGLAPDLLGHAKEQLLQYGFEVTTLWVLRDNQRAISFYLKHGFEPDGFEKEDQRDGFTLHEIRMRA